MGHGVLVELVCLSFLGFLWSSGKALATCLVRINHWRSPLFFAICPVQQSHHEAGPPRACSDISFLVDTR